MSILKRFLVEDLPTLFRGSARPAKERSSKARASKGWASEQRTVDESAEPARCAAPGARVLLLNWKAGENDPFSVVNETIAEHFRACGKQVAWVEIADAGWPSRVAELGTGGVEMAFTWQGLGSQATFGRDGKCLWEHFRIPLICLHGDHPSHMPQNHALESRYCFHLYTNADFARYSNRFFRRSASASVIDIPKLHGERPSGPRLGDYFVFGKNIDDPVQTEQFWQQRLDKFTFELYMAAAEALKSRIVREHYVEIHDVLDAVLRERGMGLPERDGDLSAYHQYHSQLDHYIRSHKSIMTVTALRDFPLRIYGRGWQRIARTSPASHVFQAGRNMADSRELYYSRFGIVDVSPSRGLHDRTRRALVNGTGFVSSANLEGTFSDMAPFRRLFFTFAGSDVADKCAAALDDPEGHQAAAQRFAELYHDRFRFKSFVDKLDDLARRSRAG